MSSFTIKNPIKQEGEEEHSNSLEQLDAIFQSVKQQIDQWGENAKWKIDLVLLDNNASEPQQPSLSNKNNNLHPLLSPQILHPKVITAPINKLDDKLKSHLLSITPTTEYPWNFIVPKKNDFMEESDELHKKLNEALERQKYLENIILSQAEQIKNSTIHNQQEKALDTMKNVFLMSQHEIKVHYLLEINLLQKDIETLSKKLNKLSSILEKIENININDDDDLLTNYKILSRKLYLSQLRLSARDSEIEYLNQIIANMKTSTKKSSTYLFQQQFNPTNSLSALDSLGIVADQMLSDPEFDHHHHGKLNELRYSESSPSPDIHHIPKKPRSTYTRWTEEEDELLRNAVLKYGHSNWEACSRIVPGRSNIQCRNRWIRHLDNDKATNNASQSPSIAALLNNNNNEYHYSPRSTSSSTQVHQTNNPNYRPPSPIPTPKNGKRRASPSMSPDCYYR